MVLGAVIPGVSRPWTAKSCGGVLADTPGESGSICQNPGTHVTYYLFAPQGSGEAESFTPLKRRTTSHTLTCE